jgi:hypothetical protein
MYDFRNEKIISLDNAECLKSETTYKFKDEITGKLLIAKLISNYDDSTDEYLVREFKKLAILSDEPEIAQVHYLAKASISNQIKSCYIMDFVSGNTLEDFLTKRDSLIYEVSFDILVQIASALDKTHFHDICHSDLHNENIIINSNGYVKLIDFLWGDFKMPHEDNIKSDIENFKRIVKELYSKCCGFDKERFKLIVDYCHNINTLNGLKKELILIDQLSFEVCLIEKQPLSILSILFQITKDDYSLKKELKGSEIDIPNNLIPELTEKEEEYKAKNELNLPNRLKYSDSRLEAIEGNLIATFDLKLFQLVQANLINWTLHVKNNGQDFVGPYLLYFTISPTSKFFHWKKCNEVIKLLKDSDKDLIDSLLE